MYNKVAILGVGLIGGSLGLEIKKRKLARLVVGFGRSKKNLQLALKKGAIDRLETSLSKAIIEADLILLCSPVSTIKKHIKAISKLTPRVSKTVFVMDVGSTKWEIVTYAQKVLPKNIHFLGAHPLAGDEKSGAVSARVSLFKGKKCLITPTALTPRPVVAQGAGFWKRMGCETVCLKPEFHDSCLAATSHLPHMAAFALMAALDSMMPSSLIKQFAGGGLIDTTRIAASDPSMWRDIALTNAKYLSRSLKRYIQKLTRLDSLIRSKKAGALTRYFSVSADLRRKLS